MAVVDDDLYDYLNQWKWHCTSRLYAMRTEIINGKKHGVLMHRFIMNAPKNMEVDHINHNTLDNRKENLRICTRGENEHNRSKENKLNPRDYTSKYKGLAINKQNGYYEVKIIVDSKKIFIGYFENEEAAANAYNEYAIKYFGEYACLNEVPIIRNWRDYKIKRKLGISNYKGVYKNEDGSWDAIIYYVDENKKPCYKYLGRRKTPEDAHNLYVKWAKILKNNYKE